MKKNIRNNKIDIKKIIIKKRKKKGKKGKKG
jgi:hypothetical protein